MRVSIADIKPPTRGLFHEAFSGRCLHTHSEAGSAKAMANWLEPFVRIDEQLLQAAGLWSETQAVAVASELRAVRPCG